MIFFLWLLLEKNIKNTLHILVSEHLLDFLECCCRIIFLKLGWEQSR